MQDEKPSRKPLVAVVGAACCAILYAALPREEGVKDEPYKDVTGLLTVCAGHVGPDVIAGKFYSQAECQELLDRDLVTAAEGVLACTPALHGHTYQLAAVIDFSYNVGVQKYCNSTMAKLFQAGKIPEACAELNKWIYAGGKVMKGIENRRQAEYKICMTKA